MRVGCSIEVVIDIDEILCPNVVSRCVDNEDGWRDTFYGDIDTPEKVYEHLAFNVMANGIEDIRRLDDWADVPDDAVRMRLDRNSFAVEFSDVNA